MRYAFLLWTTMLVACGDAGDDDMPHSTPTCASPAPLSLAREGGVEGSYIVTLRPDVEDRERTIDALARRHGFVVERDLPIVDGFSARLDPETIAALRCESAVRSVTQSRRTRALAD